MPLFSPIYSSTRPYSQTRSNTARDLMLSDEVLRLDNRKCLVLFQGHKPAMLYKLTPEEIPGYRDLKSCRVIDYIPEWKRRELGESVCTDETVRTAENAATFKASDTFKTDGAARTTDTAARTMGAGTAAQSSSHGGTRSARRMTTASAPQTLNFQTSAGISAGTQTRQARQSRTQSRHDAGQRTGGTWTDSRSATRPGHAATQAFAPAPVQQTAGWNAQKQSQPQNNPQESIQEPPPELEYDYSSLSRGPGVLDISDWEEIPDEQTGEAQSMQQSPQQENSQSGTKPPLDDSLGMVECTADLVLGL